MLLLKYDRIYNRFIVLSLGKRRVRDTKIKEYYWFIWWFIVLSTPHKLIKSNILFCLFVCLEGPNKPAKTKNNSYFLFVLAYWKGKRFTHNMPLIPCNFINIFIVFNACCGPRVNRVYLHSGVSWLRHPVTSFGSLLALGP